MDVTQGEDYFTKLEILKDVRQKTIQAEKIKLNIKDMFEDLNNEEKCLQDYQAEIELLIQEKMAHVEELRLIHTDINTMENLAKQAKSSRQRLADEIKKAYDEFRPMKKELDEMRETIGISPLTDLDVVPTVAQLDENCVVSENKNVIEQEPPESTSAHMKIPPKIIPSGKVTLGKTGMRQQQPPPMKSCQSCHQLIHRNAPICPLCKAKSRSRNPKKTKRKHEL